MKLYKKEIDMCINCPAIMGLNVGAWCNEKEGLKITAEYLIHPDCPLEDAQLDCSSNRRCDKSGCEGYGGNGRCKDELGCNDQFTYAHASRNKAQVE